MVDISARVKRSFAPIVDRSTQLLILGSLPGEISLQRGEYYANPRNQFWRLMELVFDVPASVSYEMRINRLQAYGVGLWDVVKSAERIGSLDANIKSHEVNSLDDIVSDLPNLKAIAFNGGKADRLGRSQLNGNYLVSMVTLPSSSPAYTAPFEYKAKAWGGLRAHLSIKDACRPM